MSTLTELRRHLATHQESTKPSALFADDSFEPLQQLLLAWAASLPKHIESEQAASIKKLLQELESLALKDEQLLALMNIVVTALEHLVAALRKHYIYEISALSENQLREVEQIQGLYYLVIDFYDKILRRQLHHCRPLPNDLSRPHWRSLLGHNKKPALLLAATLYQTLLFYQKLLHEQVLSESPPLAPLWSVVNAVYLFAYQHSLSSVDISAVVTAQKANTIHKLYKQICLHALLNLPAMPRSNRLLIQRFLPSWSRHVTTSLAPQTNTRVFVDLQGHRPPEYLDANTSINPYKGTHQCLFIELSSLAQHLQKSQLARSAQDSHSVEYQLIERLLASIDYRYLQRQTCLPSKRSPKQDATLITQFKMIYDHIAKSAVLTPALAVKSVAVKTFDSTDVFSQFRVLHLPAKAYASKAELSYNKNFLPDTADSERNEQIDHSLFFDILTSAREALYQHITKGLRADEPLDQQARSHSAVLQIDLLLLLSRPRSSDKLQNSIGLVRWLHWDKQQLELEWQILGHKVTACTLRLDNSSAHSMSELPTILVDADEELQTKASLLVPSYHFNSHNRAVLSIEGQPKKSLHLQRCLLRTTIFSQYEFEFIT